MNKINAPDLVTLKGDKVKVISAGRVTDRFSNRFEAVERRPERVEVPSISGMSVVRVQFVVSGSGRFTVTVDSAKGGVLEAAQTLP